MWTNSNHRFIWVLTDIYRDCLSWWKVYMYRLLLLLTIFITIITFIIIIIIIITSSFWASHHNTLNKINIERSWLLSLLSSFYYYYNIIYRSFDENIGLSKIKFPPDDNGFDHVVEPKLIVYLLYKPGHYDILYK